MNRFGSLLQVGHWPTLLASFLYFDFCFAIWVLNGAMAPFISESLGLDAVQKGVMVSLPILAGALIRLPLGVLSQYIGRKNAALLEMALIVLALAYGYLFVDTYGEVLAMGVLLGIAGASFAVALSLGSGWYPPHMKGLAMGIAGAGNAGTVLATLFAPPLAARFGWSAVYGIAAITMLLPMTVMLLAAREPPERERQSLRAHLGCLFEADGWTFSFVYVITAGGFIGIVSFLPTYFHDQFQVSKVAAGQLTMLATIMSAVARIGGGYVADRIGGVSVLSGVLLLVSVTLATCGIAGNSLLATTLLLIVYFAALGFGSGALFQLVPLRWPTTTAVAGSMIGEIGTLGGGAIPNLMGHSKQLTGTFAWGFATCALVTAGMLVMLRIVQRGWNGSWAAARIPNSRPGLRAGVQLQDR